MKIATTTYDFVSYVQRADEAVELLSDTPFRYLDLGFGKMTPDGEQESVAQRCGEHGMKFVQAHSAGVTLFSPDRDENAQLARFERELKACRLLEIPCIVVHALFAGKESPDYPDGKEEFFQTNLRFYERLYPLMEKYGVKVLVENSALKNTGGKYYFLKGEELREFLDLAKHPLLEAVWDTGHANMDNIDQYESLMALGDKLCAVHVHDNMGVKDTHQAPLFGTTDFDAIVRGLRDASFGGYFTLEADNFPMIPGGWPYKRRESEQARLRGVNLQTKLECERMLYGVAKQILDSYGLYEQ